MLSTATVALLSSAAYADTTVNTGKTDHYTTGSTYSVSTDTGTKDAGNITIQSGGSISASGNSQAAITINSNNWVLNQGAIANKDKDSAHGIRVDLSADRNLSSASFTTTASGTVNGAGIFLDSSSALTISGSGTGKHGIFLDATGCASSACTFTGDITTVSGSTLSVTGDTSTAIDITNKGVLQGNLTLGGTIGVNANTTTNASNTGVYGLLSQGTINGNVSLESGSSMSVRGNGARGISIQGGGVNGYISIGGAVETAMVQQVVTNPNQQVNTTTNAEGGPGLEVGSNVTGGIAILGPTAPGVGATSASITVQGTGPAVFISPYVNSTISSASPPTGPLTIGAFNDTVDPGFSFYNRGTVTIAPTNFNDPASAMAIVGYSATYPTVLTGGLFNSGSMSSSVVTSGSGKTSSGIFANGVVIGDYAQLGIGTGKIANDQINGVGAAFVNSGGTATGNAGGVISASLSGANGGTAQAVLISTYASVPSLINSGTIAAVATTTDKTLAGNIPNSNNPLIARAIYDLSGTLTSIVNSGTIHASSGYVATSGAAPTPLDNNSQVAIAIDLAGSGTSPSASGVTIQNLSSNTRSAVITGDIYFGTGSNQILSLLGTTSAPSIVTGNVVFGPVASGTTSGDQLNIGQWSTLTGQVTTLESLPSAGVQVSVDTKGTLTLLNSGASLNATTVVVNNGGTINLGVNQSLTATGGVIAASQSVDFKPNSILSVAYASFVPQAEHKFVLMTAPTGSLTIDPTVLSTFNATVARPYMLETATMCVTSTPGCTPPTNLQSGLDALIIDVVPKGAVDPNSFNNPSHAFQPDTTQYLGLYPGSVAVAVSPAVGGGNTTLFDQVNTALAADNALGSAMINGIHNAKEAATAYNAFAPNITGASRAIVISITDQASGPVGQRERMLNMYGKTDGDSTLWGQQFVQMLKDPGTGAIDPNTGFKTNPGYKDHGFGFALGMDTGSPRSGWYGGAFTFYAGDVNELANTNSTITGNENLVGRNSHGNEQWYLLNFYSVWRGKGLFLDTNLGAGYAHIDGKRTLTLTTSVGGVPYAYTREADNKHAGALISGGLSTGAMLSYGATTFMPQFSLDGMYMREEGYTEHNPNATTVGDAFNLRVEPTYAKSLRAFLGMDVRYDLQLWDFFLQPEARAGYRYDFLKDPMKVKAAFAYSDVSNPAVPSPGPLFQLTGPDPSQGNFVLGGALAATTDTWSLGFNYDFVRGSNGAFSQVGSISLLGRI
jgi:hypothetical protein